MLRVRRLGRVPYQEALALQRALFERAEDDYLLALEHPHVYTLGIRADPANVLVDPASVGAALEVTDRGGDVTYHGPGQLVLYPIITLADDPGAGRDHVHRLEDVVIGALVDLGVGSEGTGIGRLEGYPGIWVGLDGPSPRKVAAVGVRAVRTTDGRRRTLHGVALNVDCDLQMFTNIVPCGIADRPVTSLRAEGSMCTMDEVVEAVLSRATATWGRDTEVDRRDVTLAGAPARSPYEVRSAELASPELASPELPSTALTAADVPLAPSSEPGRRPVTSAEDRGALRAASPATGSATPTPVPVSLSRPERPLLRRLRQAGVDPDAGLEISARKPDWLRIPARMGEGFLDLGRTIHDLGLVTVCEEAGCPNIYECWADGTATFMINGSRCTRACGFCLVDTRHPLPLDAGEPDRVAEAVERMRLAHAVVTCVARDDLCDGGAGAMAETIAAIRDRRPATTIEVLISDCKGDGESLATIFDARPDVLNHNIETVARLQRAVRPSAGYARSLSVLARAADAGLVVKSGLMVGLGETYDEVVSTLADLRGVGVSIATIGQYLRPSRDHLPVDRWWTPEELSALGDAGRALGLAHVESSPLTRSSYHARDAAAAAGAVPVTQ